MSTRRIQQKISRSNLPSGCKSITGWLLALFKSSTKFQSAKYTRSFPTKLYLVLWVSWRIWEKLNFRSRISRIKTSVNFRLKHCSIYFFREKHTNRRLKWIYNHSHADLRTCATQKMYVLKVTTFQLGILNSFNEADQLTLSEIRRETALENKGIFKI